MQPTTHLTKLTNIWFALFAVAAGGIIAWIVIMGTTL
jgi:hypothetical protein